MNTKLAELQDSIASYALEHSINEIPRHYYEDILKTWAQMDLEGYNWDKSKAAAALLYVAVLDGIVHMSQLTPRGYRAINWAENFMQKLDAVAAA